MKKVLALVLAVVLAFGMTTVAFAAAKAESVKLVDSGTPAAKYLYTFDGDKLDEVPVKVTGNVELKANKEYFLLLATDTTDVVLDKLSVLNDVKVRASIDVGNSYIAAKPSFVIKNVKEEKYGIAAGKKAFVSFKTADKFNMDAEDLEMTISLYNKKGDKNDEIDINGTVGYASSTPASYYRVTGPINNFDDIDGDVEMEFGDDEITFVVNADGQKELFLRLDDSDDALEDKYPDADLQIVYFAGNNKTFRRSGELKIPAEMIEGKEGKLVAPFIYENNNGKLTVCKDAKYDSDKEAFIIKTNKLGKYVISDKELKAEEAKEDGKTDDKDGAEKNPDTGANDFVGLAVALAVVSVAGIAVAKRK